MSAIVTDQLRIINAKNFVAEITSSNNSYYSFVGLTNPENYSGSWDENPPSPRDSFNDENHIWDTIIGLKKISSDDVRFALNKNTWSSGITYDMYRHDITRNSLSLPSQSTSLYSSSYYIINKDYKVYICLHNGTDPENPNGRPSIDEPTFTDLEPRSAGSSDDGYIWKYLFTINPSDIVKFDTLNYITAPVDWETNEEYSAIRNNALNSGQIKVAKITSRGVDVGPANSIYTCKIIGNGTGAEATISINNQSKVDSITISKGGSGYTYGKVDLTTGGFPTNSTTDPSFEVIIPPKNGHGYDIYRELGAKNVLIYSQIKNDSTNPDFIVGNKIAQLGLVANPQSFDSTQLLTSNQASSLYALKLTGANDANDYKNASFDANSEITQTVSTGTTAIGKVVSYNKNTGVLKYWQDRTQYGFNFSLESGSDGEYGNKLISFTSSIGSGGSLNINGGNKQLKIDTTFDGNTFTINNQNYYLGQVFNDGVSNPEVKKYSGEIVYIDNRPSITRSQNQREDIKIVLQF